jgi:glycosyltransferase involved in cell wall biosynthesis
MDDFTPRLRSESLRQRVGATDRPLLLFVGRLVREKNLAELAEAVERLAGWESRFRLAIVGDGPMKDELMARLPAAHFAGFQEGRQLAEWYASADVFVFPSTTETFGNVILEAFASGLPVIAADKGGTRDLVAHGENGLLTKPGDAADLAQQIHTLLDRPSYATKLGCGALRTAASYEWSAVNRALLDGYRRVLAEGVRAA